MGKNQSSDMVWLWGFHAVRAAWGNPDRRVHALLVTEKTAQEAQGFAPPGNEAKRPRPDIVDRRVLDKRLPEGAVHQGVAIQCDPLPEMFLSDLAVRARTGKPVLIVMLDQVTDPHNVGAILRSAAAFGANGLIVQTRHAPEATGTMAKAACGALEHVPVIRETNLSRAIDTLRESGVTVIGLDERGEDIAAHSAGARGSGGSLCLVLGAEGPGMRPKVREHCDALVRLPTGGPVPTLNVSNAAAVALYALRA